MLTLKDKVWINTVVPIVSQRLRELWDNAAAAGRPQRPLADVAQDHGKVLWPSDYPSGGAVGPESPTILLDRGYNGKRPLYLVQGADGSVHAAWGTWFGRSSGFAFYWNADALLLERIFSPAERSRILYDFEAALARAAREDQSA